MRWRELVEDIDLSEWLEDYAETKSGGGHELILKECPECLNDNFKVYVHTEKMLWICYRCDWGRGLGDITRLMAAVSGRSLSSVRAEILALTTPSMSDLDDDADDEDLPRDELEAVELPGWEMHATRLGERVGRYAQARGLRQDELERVKARCALKLPTPQGGEVKGPWLVFPVVFGIRPVAWQARRLSDDGPKYLSSPSIKKTLFPADEQTWALYTKTAENTGVKTIYLVEGPLDALGMQRMGYPALCTFGKSLSQKQLDLLLSLDPEEIIFCWDNDAPAEVLRAMSRLPAALIRVLAVDFSRDDGLKVDPGDALASAAHAAWVSDRVTNCRVDPRDLI